MKKWKRQSSHYELQAWPYLRVRQDDVLLPNGMTITRYNVVEMPDVVLIFGLTLDDQVLLVEQYKHGIGEICLELPAGMIEGDGDPATEARREFLEETGYDADDYRLLGTFTKDPSRATNRAFVFLAQGARRVRDQDLDATEDITVHHIHRAKLTDLIRCGRIHAIGSVMAIYHALDYLSA